MASTTSPGRPEAARPSDLRTQVGAPRANGALSHPTGTFTEMESFDPSYLAQLRSNARSAGLAPADALAVLEEIERMRTADIERQQRLIEGVSETERLRADLAAEIAIADGLANALLSRAFRGDRRDRMYGSDWEPVHDALDEWEARRVR